MNTVKGLCESFTKGLEKIKTKQDALAKAEKQKAQELSVASLNAENRAKLHEAEIKAANSAIINIKNLFGLNLTK